MNLFRPVGGLLEASLRLLRAARIPWTRFAGAGVACALLGGAGFVAVRPDLWLVEHVVFDGASHVRPAELRHLMDLPNGTGVWAVDTGRLAAALEHHPWVRRATVTFELPDTVRVAIEERHTVALLHDGDALLYVDQEGVPFLPADFRTSARPDLDLVHLTGMGSELVALHPELAPRAIRDALWLVNALDARALVPAHRISEVAFSRTSGFVVVAPPSRLAFGLSDLPSQVDRLERLVDSGLSLDEPRHVDLAPATVAIVRPLAPATGLPPAPPAPGGG